MTSAPLLNGILPVQTFNPEGFVGTLTCDGQSIRVSAIAGNDTGIALLALVGFDTSISAALARLNLKDQLPFTPAEGLEWRGPTLISRLAGTSYRQIVTALSIKTGEKPVSLREKQALYMPICLDIADGIRHPPDLPPEPQEGASPSTKATTPIVNRMIVANQFDILPAQEAFLGTLTALHVPFLRARTDTLHAHTRQHTETATWAAELWAQALTQKLITPLPALGIRAWEIAGDRRLWLPLISEGITKHWLPWSTGLETMPCQHPA